jgi:S-adenosylmethionine synthetase
VDSIVISAQHREEVELKVIRKDIFENVIKAVIPERYLDSNTKIFINPTGRFVIGGPAADTGLTGRKIAVDTYGGYARHGGGAFSGKDPSKLDRSAAYAARWIAKSVVASSFAKKCEVQLAYAIGVAQPVSIFIETFNTAKIPEAQILQIIKKTFDLRPFMIIKQLGLLRKKYTELACYGQFGNEVSGREWENSLILTTSRDDLSRLARS